MRISLFLPCPFFTLVFVICILINYLLKVQKKCWIRNQNGNTQSNHRHFNTASDKIWRMKLYVTVLCPVVIMWLSCDSRDSCNSYVTLMWLVTVIWLVWLSSDSPVVSRCWWSSGWTRTHTMVDKETSWHRHRWVWYGNIAAKCASSATILRNLWTSN